MPAVARTARSTASRLRSSAFSEELDIVSSPILRDEAGRGRSSVKSLTLSAGSEAASVREV